MSEPTIREAIESAVTQEEAASAEPTGTPAPAPSPAPAESAPAPAPAESESAPVEQTTEPKAETKTIEPAPAPPDLLAEAPKSWKTSSRTHWGAIPKEAREEIHRRDREVFRIFGESSQARKLQADLNEMVRPYEARIRGTGQSTIQVLRNLLDYDNALATAPPTRRAQLAAQLIKDYGISIPELDAALSGSEPADPVAATVERLLGERLAPFQQYLQSQEQQEQHRNQNYVNEAAQTVESMAINTAKYPHFDTVREDMADLVEVSGKRGVYLTPDQAYNRAVAMNPELGAQVAAQRQAEAQRQQAQAQHARAQKALNASSSVAGAPTGTPGTGGSAANLRDAVENAFNSVTSR